MLIMLSYRALPGKQKNDLQYHEQRIEKGMQTFLEVGEALCAIRDGRLYRVTHGDFKTYCREKWGLSQRHVNRIIEGNEVVKELGPIGPKITTESQARELSKVEPAKREEVLTKAVAATGGKLTAKAIAEAAKASSPPCQIGLLPRCARSATPSL